MLCFNSGPPDPPQGTPKISEVCSDSLRLDWQPPVYDGGGIIMSYTVEKMESGTGVWEKCSSTHVTHATVHRLKEHKEYKFRVFADNLYGTSETSKESDRVFVQEPKIEIDYDKLGKFSPQLTGGQDSRLTWCESFLY